MEAANNALTVLKKNQDSIPLPVTTDKQLIKTRILKIVDAHLSGVFTTQFSKFYKDQFQELLPENWMEIVKQSPEIHIEIGANNTRILTRSTPPAKVIDVRNRIIMNNVLKCVAKSTSVNFPILIDFFLYFYYNQNVILCDDYLLRRLQMLNMQISQVVSYFSNIF